MSHNDAPTSHHCNCEAPSYSDLYLSEVRHLTEQKEQHVEVEDHDQEEEYVPIEAISVTGFLTVVIFIFWLTVYVLNILRG